MGRSGPITKFSHLYSLITPKIYKTLARRFASYTQSCNGRIAQIRGTLFSPNSLHQSGGG